MNRRIVIGIVSVAVVVIFFSLVFTGVIPGLRKDITAQRVTLTMWGVFDGADAFNGVMSAYKAKNPNVDVIYKQFAPEDYERELVNALAAGKGPDIFMVHNTWLPKHYDKMLPLAPEKLSIATFRNLFPRVVEQDFAPDEIIYALPLYIDSLALFYNKDAFDNAGIALPPKNWNEVTALIPKLRVRDRSGRIIKAAAAIGGTPKSINRATDLLSLIMMQGGAPMVSSDFRFAQFASLGAKGFDFYTQFADPKSPSYTWNEQLHYSLDAFAEGSAAMMFNYAYNIKALKQKNPFLEFGVASMPQPSTATTRVDYANYFGLAVSGRSRNAATAWDFIQFLTTNANVSNAYLKASGHPPALRTLIAAGSDESELGVFTKQALTARSYPQIDNVEVERIMGELIENAIYGKLSKERALRQAEDAITNLIRERTR